MTEKLVMKTSPKLERLGDFLTEPKNVVEHCWIERWLGGSISEARFRQAVKNTTGREFP